MWSRIAMNTSQLVGSAAAPAAPPPSPAAGAPPRFFIRSITSSGGIFFRNSSFWDAMMSPEILSLPVLKSFMGSALPVHMSMKSPSLSSRVHWGFWVSPAVTPPGAFLTSIVHTLSGALSLNW